MVLKIGGLVMNDDEIYFDMDENMGSYYDFNLLDLLEDNNEADSNLGSTLDDKLMVKLG